MDSGEFEEHQAEDRRQRLIAQRNSARLDPAAFRENAKVEPPGEGVENLVHAREHEVVLLHVRAAHMLGKAGGRRLVLHEVRGTLNAVSEGKLRLHIEVRGFLHHRQEVLGRDLAEHVPRALGLPHIAGDEARVREAHLGELLAGVEMHHAVLLEAGVRLSPSKRGNLNHQ
jgi:hypothetical protein